MRVARNAVLGLAIFFGGLFFPAGNDTAQLLASLAAFGAGFGVR